MYISIEDFLEDFKNKHDVTELNTLVCVYKHG